MMMPMMPKKEIAECVVDGSTYIGEWAQQREGPEEKEDRTDNASSQTGQGVVVLKDKSVYIGRFDQVGQKLGGGRRQRGNERLSSAMFIDILFLL